MKYFDYNKVELSYNFGNDASLCCPNCGGTFIHQSGMESFYRNKEDSETGIHTRTNTNKTAVGKDMRLNPSMRRDGFRLRFSCENCPEISYLVFQQHKGITFVGWEKE